MIERFKNLTWLDLRFSTTNPMQELKRLINSSDASHANEERHPREEKEGSKAKRPKTQIS